VADQDGGSLEAWLTEIESDIATKQLMATELRRRLGRPAAEDGGVVFSPGTHLTPGGFQASVQIGRIRPDEFFQLSIPDAIQKYLGIMKSPQGPKAIMEGLRAGGLLTNATHFYANVTTALKRLRVKELAVLTPNGWGLTGWYSSKPKGKGAAKKGRKGKRKGAKKRPEPAPAPPKRRIATIRQPVAPTGEVTYRQFVGKAMKEGKSMSEAAALWKKQKGEG
jgi:hypothetical protein